MSEEKIAEAMRNALKPTKRFMGLNGPEGQNALKQTRYDGGAIGAANKADENIEKCLTCHIYVRKGEGQCSYCRSGASNTHPPLVETCTVRILPKDVLKAKGEFDVVERPRHYNASKFEVFDVLQEWARAGMISYSISNVIKYCSRYKLKGKPLEDLKKALWYLQREIEEYENKNQ